MPAVQIFHGGNSTFFSSTCLIKPNFSVSLLQQYSTTVSLDTRDLFGFINGAIRKLYVNKTDWPRFGLNVILNFAQGSGA